MQKGLFTLIMMVSLFVSQSGFARVAEEVLTTDSGRAAKIQNLSEARTKMYMIALKLSNTHPMTSTLKGMVDDLQTLINQLAGSQNDTEAERLYQSGQAKERNFYRLLTH